MLDGFRAQGAGPTGTVSRDTVVTHALQFGFDSNRLAEAFASLVEKGCAKSYGDGRVGLTELGFLSSASTPAQY